MAERLLYPPRLLCIVLSLPDCCFPRLSRRGEQVCTSRWAEVGKTATPREPGERDRSRDEKASARQLTPGTLPGPPGFHSGPTGRILQHHLTVCIVAFSIYTDIIKSKNILVQLSYLTCTYTNRETCNSAKHWGNNLL